MFSNKARWLVGFLLLIVAMLAITLKVYEIAALSFLFVGLVIWGYFKEGPIILAAKQFKNKDYEAAKNLLLSIAKPQYLSKKRKPYYEYLLGCIAVHQMDYQTAEKHLEKAAFSGLKVQDLGTAIMHLANINLRNKQKDKGLLWIAEAKKIPLPARQQSILKNLEKELHQIK
ncbi:tetratricopeptide repeat protein [Pedobacter puniceum]|jgi:hypothetical protein|uniref:Tetratricopeptide repeat protein n=1 Tax=Pedobacter puniceum TaxID=2666136 RepID=A0A7K0FRH1_9SPHI|nr:tetratricopeptide repeat protein [Pedobacter puniceum]MRX48221.1 tetratricopeptide repeat protein [Pedobacter puniceum]